MKPSDELNLSFFKADDHNLASQKLWSAVTSEHLTPEQVASIPGEKLTFDPGQIIVAEGDHQVDDMYFVLSGKVYVYKAYQSPHELMLAILQPGDLFGEMGLFLQEPRSASVVAYDKVTVNRVSKSAVGVLLTHNPHVSVSIITTLCARLKNVLS